ncbi:VolA/Pla-1 family phospholipase [Pseudocolwellia sp. HL-MZ19]|uniref:VolA/Pla-1 family phospholipase n=1 Tax=Pseudocolwellia sp. HL-MZ19 TaxID=3400846 RepID=UPI003CF87D52
MKKLLLSVTIAGVLGLAGCDSESLKDVQQSVENNNSGIKASARVVFDPTNGLLSVPNDLLFQDTVDGTLNLPVDDASDESDPFVALSALDGWSTVNPFVLSIDFPTGTSLDADSVVGGVQVFEATMGGDANDADCTSVTRGFACKVVSQLTFGVDYFAQKSGDSVAIVPLKPLKAETTYLVALTDALKDSNGQAVGGSTTYELVRQDFATKPLATEAQLGLQAIINSFEDVIINEGVEADSLIYTMAMTTQSTTRVLDTLKGLMAANLGAGGAAPAVTIDPSGATVNDVFLSQGLTLSPDLQALYSTANYHKGAVTLPYYLGVPSADNPLAPVNSWWKARCDSGATLLGLATVNPSAIPADALDANDGFCMAVGLRDLSSAFDVDTERNLTKFNPIPVAQTEMEIEVQMTTPQISPVTDAVRANFGLPALVTPDNGWPVVMLQHGITSKKDDMLAMTGILSTFGFATIAIDHPLHGSRGFDLDGDTIDDINASTVSATHYMNLASLLTTRDNLRQSTIDTLGLRLGLNALVGADIDTSEVHYLGHSLGAISGINFVALANTSINPLLDDMFKVTSNSLAMPGTMVANFLLESPAFGDLIKATLTLSQSTEFATFVSANFPDATEAELAQAYTLFYANLTEEQQAGLNGVFSQFTFAAQTVTDAGDPINYITQMAETQTPTHLIEVVGDGGTNLSDQVIPNRITTSPLGGTEGAIALLGLPSVSSTSAGSGAVRFLNGHHGSILTPEVRDEAPDAALTGAATQEMQSQVTGFFATKGTVINVTNTTVVQ